MYGPDMKLAMVITYFGDSTSVFQFFQRCCFYLDLCIWKVDIMLYQTCFEMVWNLPLFYLCYLLCLHIYICSCSALIYHYACLPDSNAPPKSECLQEPPWRRWGVTFGIRAYGLREGIKRFLKTFEKLFSKPSIKYFPKKSLVYFKGYSPKSH